MELALGAGSTIGTADAIHTGAAGRAEIILTGGPVVRWSGGPVVRWSGGPVLTVGPNGEIIVSFFTPEMNGSPALLDLAPGGANLAGVEKLTRKQ